MPEVDLREQLVQAGLTGEVATSPGNTAGNCRKVVEGDPAYTFGLGDHTDASVEEVERAVRKYCGDAAIDGEPQGPGFIDPDTTLAGITRHNEVLRRFVDAGGGTVLLATGHPTGLLAHYQAVARRLRKAGCRVLTPLDDTYVLDQPRRVGLRYLDGVACAWAGGDLLHRHRSDLMEAALARLDADGAPPDLVLGDHGFAGAAIEHGVPTCSIADVNDPALLLAQARGRTDGVLVIDDNLAPRRFVAVTRAVLRGVGVASGSAPP